MKTIFKNIVLALTLGTAVTLNSCSSDFLDITPTDQYSEDAMFSDAALSQAFLNFNLRICTSRCRRTCHFGSIG